MSDILYIPIRESALLNVSVPLESLPTTDLGDLAGILTNELASPDLWLRFALEFYNRGLPTHYLDLLRSLTAEEASQAYSAKEFTASRIAVLTSLAGYQTLQGWYASDNPENRTQCYQEAIQFLNTATLLDFMSPASWVSKGMLLLAQGQFDAAQRSFDSAINYDAERKNGLAFIGKALCYYHKRQFRDAAKAFVQSLLANPAMPVTIWNGLGLCYIQLKDSAMAKKTFERILERDSSDVTALTATALLILNEAKSNFSHDNSDGGGNNSLELIHSALALLSQAYSHNPSHPLTLLLVADHFYHRGDHSTVRTLATRGLSLIDQSFHAMRSELYYQLARSYHSEEDYSNAYQCYDLAKRAAEESDRETKSVQSAQQPSLALSSKHNNNHTNNNAEPQCQNPLILLGFAQCLIQRNDSRQALKILESLHARHGEDADIARLLGGVYTSLGQYEQAAKLLMLAVSASPYDIELLCELALCLEQIEGRKPEAKAVYLRAINAIETIHTDQTVPFQLVHNLAVLCQELGEIDDARLHYHRALKLINNDSDSEAGITPAALTTRYNLALLEHQRIVASASSMKTLDQSQFDNIVTSYQSLIDAHPSYIDPYLRLGSLYLQRSMMAESKSYFDRAFEKNPQHLETLTLRAQWLLANDDLKNADRNYNKICRLTAAGKVSIVDNYETGAGANEDDEDEEKAFKGDPYAKVALGNLYFIQGKKLTKLMKPTLSDVQMKMTRSKSNANNMADPNYWIREASRWFGSVLRSDPKNVYAAHGLGCVLAEQGEMTAAKEVFSSVRESKPEFVEASINLANILSSQSLYAAAIKLYEDSLSRLDALGGTNVSGEDITQQRVEVLMAMSKSYYMWTQLNESLACIDRAITLKPRDALLWYNRALAQEEFSVGILRKPVAERSLREVEQAVERLTQAIQTLERLEQAGKLFHARKQAALKQKLRKKAMGAAAGEEKQEESKVDTDTSAATTNDGPDMTVQVNINHNDAATLVCPSAAALDARDCQSFDLEAKAKAHLLFCKQTLSPAKAHLDHAKKRESELAEMSLRLQEARDRELEQQRKVKEDENEKRRVENERAEAIAQENKAKLAALQEDWVATKRAEKEEEDMIDDTGADGDDGDGKRKRTTKKKKSKRASASDDDGDGEERSERKKKKQRRSEIRGQERDRSTTPQPNDDAVNDAEDADNDSAAGGDGMEEWQRIREARRKQAVFGGNLAKNETAGEPAAGHPGRRGRLQRMAENDEEGDEIATAPTVPTDATSRKRRTIVDDEEDDASGIAETTEDVAAEDDH